MNTLCVGTTLILKDCSYIIKIKGAAIVPKLTLGRCSDVRIIGLSHVFLFSHWSLHFITVFIQMHNLYRACFFSQFNTKSICDSNYFTRNIVNPFEPIWIMIQLKKYLHSHKSCMKTKKTDLSFSLILTYRHLMIPMILYHIPTEICEHMFLSRIDCFNSQNDRVEN